MHWSRLVVQTIVRWQHLLTLQLLNIKKKLTPYQPEFQITSFHFHFHFISFTLQSQNHSTIVDLPNHSTIVDSEFCPLIHPQSQPFQNVKMFGKFQSYPEGICNPAFTGMILWEYCEDHICNDYKISEFHNLKSGIILNGTVAYIFTPIENNDIKSHIKILLQNKKLKNWDTRQKLISSVFSCTVRLCTVQ